jgi:Tol biopolymer transport system component
MWCAYPDGQCPSGYRYSTANVGDGLSGQCVPLGTKLDAGVDAPTDAKVGDGNVTCKLRIAFEDGAVGSRSVWTSNPDGSGLQNVSNGGTSDNFRPTWSPDGVWVLFESNRTGRADIFLVKADGSFLTNLTQNRAAASHQPVWSPDGAHIAFVDGGTGSVFVMNADGTSPTQASTLTQTNDLAWSPDSTKLVFGHVNPNIPGLYVVTVGSVTSAMAVTPSGQFAAGASWAPNSKILYYSGGSQFDIFSVNGDGSGVVDITNDTPTEDAPQWSGDGSLVAFSSNKNGEVDVWKTASTGGAQTQLTTSGLTTSGTGDFVTSFSSDGLLVAFQRQTSSTTSKVGVVHIDGTGIVTFDSGAGNARNGKFSVCH